MESHSLRRNHTHQDPSDTLKVWMLLKSRHSTIFLLQICCHRDTVFSNGELATRSTTPSTAGQVFSSFLPSFLFLWGPTRGTRSHFFSFLFLSFWETLDRFRDFIAEKGTPTNPTRILGTHHSRAVIFSCVTEYFCVTYGWFSFSCANFYGGLTI